MPRVLGVSPRFRSWSSGYGLVPYWSLRPIYSCIAQTGRIPRIVRPAVCGQNVQGLGQLETQRAGVDKVVHVGEFPWRSGLRKQRVCIFSKVTGGNLTTHWTTSTRELE